MIKLEFDPSKLKLVDPKTLTLDPKNRNKHPPEQIERLCKLYEKFGMRWPILVSERTGVIKAGEGRLLAALQLQMPQVLVSYQDFDSDETEYAFGISDNGIAAWAELDLSSIHTDLKDMPDMDIELLGIKDFVLVDTENLEPGCDEDEVPEHVEPKTKLGDLYLLGNHRLLCGDSTSIDAVEKLMGGKKADMVCTDPPYGMNLDTDYSFAKNTYKNVQSNGGNKYRPVIGDNEDFKPELIHTIFASFPEVKELFLWGADYYADLLPNRNDGSWIVWDKRQNDELDDTKAESADKAFGSAFELCWSKSKHKRLMARVRSGIFGLNNEQGNTKRFHPTEKPVQLSQWFFDHWGNENDLVVDLFGGSGSTLIACEKTNRKCFMMELDPHYCDVIVARWEKYSGKKAELINGETADSN